LQEAVDAVDERAADVIENGTALFWAIIREAVQARAES
jgi:hypothetical protein